jgi:KaiC/GvpD/RAD55 family RecA-like ATPase
MPAAQSDRVRTGISGLDAILSGGIPRGNVILVEGAIGTGKTTFGTEFVYRGATEFGEPGVIVVFEISPDKLTRDAAGLGWDLRALEERQLLRIIYTTIRRATSSARSCSRPTASSSRKRARSGLDGSSSTAPRACSSSAPDRIPGRPFTSSSRASSASS